MASSREEKSRVGVKTKLEKRYQFESFKADLLSAWQEAGGYQRLVKWMRDPQNFGDVVKLMARLLPKTVEGSGEGGSFTVEITRYGEQVPEPVIVPLANVVKAIEDQTEEEFEDES